MLAPRLVISGVLLATMPLFSTAVSAGDRVYQYNQSSGVPLFTDKRHASIKPTKVRYYGRPTAVTTGCNLRSEKLRQRIDRYEETINSLAEKYSVSRPVIKAVIATESCYNPKAISTAGAQGLMQLMPDTARMLKVSDPFDPQENIKGGVRYLRMMLDEFDQDLSLALAAYNAGPAAVKKYGRIPPYRETQHYVKKVLRMVDS